MTDPLITAEIRRGGAPRKARGGLNKVLFVRADQELVDRLKAIQRREAKKGTVLSVADIVRALLWDALSTSEGL